MIRRLRLSLIASCIFLAGVACDGLTIETATRTAADTSADVTAVCGNGEIEADDMIASYAREATARGWDVTIVSSDKDLMQLIGRDAVGGGHVDMLDTMKNVRIDEAEVAEKFGVTPDLVGDVLALMGDTADNVPGIRGIGPKTATKLIQDHGTLEATLAAAPEMKPGKLRGPDRAAVGLT